MKVMARAVARILYKLSSDFRFGSEENWHMTCVVRDLCTLALIFVLTTATAWAQLATAELNGRVTDSSGAVLPGVTVTATQTATGLVRTAVTDENGGYLLSNMPTGPYRLEVALQGFRTYDRHRAASRRDADD
jgi:hypothetical protein